MRKLFYMGLEPYEGRYTLQLEEWSRRAFLRRDIDWVSVPGTTIDNTKAIQVGQVLDAHGRSYFAMSQMMNLVQMMRNGEVTGEDVVFFEDMLNNEPDMCQRVLNGLPKHMRKNFLDNIVGFMKLRQEEIQIYNQFVYDGLPLVPCIQKSTLSDDILDELLAIYRELPKPLQFTRDDFIESISDPETILNMLRIGDSNGRIIGFAKGGPLEKYNFDLDFEDRNRGKNNTVFLEPVAIKNGYWGFHGGRELRQLFMMQVQSKGYKFMTSFAMRDVIDERKENDKNVVFVKKFDPERWDYFRVTL